MIGPPLARLTRRLGDTPPEFLDEPRIGQAGRVAVAALVNDLLVRHGGRGDRTLLVRFEGHDARADRNRLSLVAVTVWLLADDAFVDAAPPRKALITLLDRTLAELADGTAAAQFVHDAERREELARTVLAALGLLPEGETAAQAQDRLSAVSAAERRRLLAASRGAEERARAIRDALAKKAAQEAADKWTRE